MNSGRRGGGGVEFLIIFRLPPPPPPTTLLNGTALTDTVWCLSASTAGIYEVVNSAGSNTAWKFHYLLSNYQAEIAS